MNHSGLYLAPFGVYMNTGLSSQEKITSSSKHPASISFTDPLTGFYSFSKNTSTWVMIHFKSSVSRIFLFRTSLLWKNECQIRSWHMIYNQLMIFLLFSTQSNLEHESGSQGLGFKLQRFCITFIYFLFFFLQKKNMT